MTPLVSVIIPCYNQAQFLPDAIESLIVQSYKNWECIIVNDGSTDNTADVAEELALTDNRIKVINQKNKGLSGARNTGLNEAKGTMLQFLDADDTLEKDKLLTHANFLKNNPRISIVFSDARYFTTDKPMLRDYGYYATIDSQNWIIDRWISAEEILVKLLSFNLFPVNCPLVQRSVFDQVGAWNENLQAHEDWEFWIRCAAKNIKIELLNQPNTLALIRMHNTSMTFETPRMLQSEFQMRVFIGPLIKSPSLRILNVKNGLKTLRLLEHRNLLKQLPNLVYANFSVRAIHMALFFYLTECSMSRYIVKRYKLFVPWPIQKFLTKLTTRI